MSQLTAQPRLAGPLQKMIPDRKNRDAWWAFLEGAPESVWNSSRPTEQRKKRGGERHEGAFTPYSGHILPSNENPQLPHSLLPLPHLMMIPHKSQENFRQCNCSILILYVSHLLDIAGYLTTRLNPALLPSSYHVLYALVQLVS